MKKFEVYSKSRLVELLPNIIFLDIIFMDVM